MDMQTLDLIRILQRDGRVPFVEAAEKLGVAEGTVRRKYARLIESGVLKVAGVVEPTAIGYSSPAIIGIRVMANHLEAVVKQLCALRRIRYVAATTGAYDVIVMAYLKDTAELYELISQKLSRIEGVASLETLVVLKTFKQSYDWVDEEDRGVGGDDSLVSDPQRE